MSTANLNHGQTERVAVITGSSKGIGKAIARVFAKSKQYSGIVTNGRKIDELRIVSDEIKSFGCDSLAIEADVSKESDCIRLIEDTINHYGRIDVLVNNAGIQKDMPFAETATEEWQNNICRSYRTICMQ